MSQTYPREWKNCATCNYWGGARDSGTLRERVTVDSANQKGKCLCRGSGWTNRELAASTPGCRGFEKWSVLK